MRAWLLLWAVLSFGAHAADQPAPPDEPPATYEPAPTSEPAPTGEPPPPYERPPVPPQSIAWKLEGAIGPLASWAPDYSGAATHQANWNLGFYLRYGRFSISNTGGFVTRREKDDVFRGLGVDLRRSENLRLNVGLRVAKGRTSTDARGLEGIDDGRQTIRARFSATWQIDPVWKMAAGLNSDILGRGGGNLVDLALVHDRRWSPSTTFSVGASMTAADERYMTSWYGVDESESAASRLPQYAPGPGLRDASLSFGARSEIGTDWIVLWGVSISRLAGPAAQSPLTTSTQQWGASGGVARRF